jgi:cytochrome bd-type quinol oxidase subunit 1
VVLGVGAWLVLRMRAVEDARMMVRMALDLLILLVPLQFFLGDLHGLNTLHYQPAKVAAIERRYDTARPEPLTLFAIPDDRDGRMRYALDIPDLGSLIPTHSRDVHGVVLLGIPRQGTRRGRVPLRAHVGADRIYRLLSQRRLGSSRLPLGRVRIGAILECRAVELV